MAEIYNENMERIENPDLSLGWLEDSVRIVHHAEIQGIEEQGHHEVVAEYPNGGKDIAWIVDVPGVEHVPAWDEEIPIQIYHPYTQEELDAMEEERNKPTYEERISALEAQLAAYEAAFAEGVNEGWA